MADLTAASIRGSVSPASNPSEFIVAPNANYGAALASFNAPPFWADATALSAMPFDMTLESTSIYWASANSTAVMSLFGWRDYYVNA